MSRSHLVGAEPHQRLGDHERDRRAVHRRVGLAQLLADRPSPRWGPAPPRRARSTTPARTSPWSMRPCDEVVVVADTRAVQTLLELVASALRRGTAGGRHGSAVAPSPSRKSIIASHSGRRRPARYAGRGIAPDRAPGSGPPPVAAGSSYSIMKPYPPWKCRLRYVASRADSVANANARAASSVARAVVRSAAQAAS